MARIVHESPEKMIVIAGPTFCEAVKFLLAGALLGAAAVHFCCPKSNPDTGAEGAGNAGSNGETLSGTGGGTALLSLAHRAKSISSRALDLAHTASEALKPALEQAVTQGKQAAAEIEAKMKKDMELAGDKPALFLEDEARTEETGKYVE